jgi:hypothetical protein
VRAQEHHPGPLSTPACDQVMSSTLLHFSPLSKDVQHV